MKLTVTQIEAFSTVVTVGTVTGAASVLHTSQPSVTRSIKQLEDATGLQLFDRVKGRLVPTRAAQDLFKIVEQTFNGLSHVRQAAESIKKRETGHIRIACLPALSQGFIARASADLRMTNSRVAVSIQTLKSSDIHKAVQSRLLDVGIAAYNIDDARLSSTQFTACNEVVVLKRDHPLANNTIIKAQELSGYSIIMLAADDPYRIRLERVLSQENVQAVTQYEVETSAGACAMVREGLGVSILNPITALDYLDKSLVMRPFGVDLPFVTSLITAPQSERTPLIESFVEVLIARKSLDDQIIQSHLR